MNVSRLLAVAFALVAASPGLAQYGIPDWENSVEFRLVASQQPIRPGDAFQVALLVDIEEGYHLYGPEEQEPSRTEVTVTGDHLEVGEPAFPPVVNRELEGLGNYDLYEGQIAIKVPVRLTESGIDGEQTVRATVNYQVCTDFACSAPTSDELAISLPVGTAGAKVEPQHPEIFQSK